MSISHVKDLMKFLKAFPSDVQERALWLRRFVWELYPTANELIYDNYNALAVGWSPTEKVGHVFCSIALGRTSHKLHFGFYWGSQIADPKGILLGEGNQYRYIIVNDIDAFPSRYMIKLLKDAYKNSMSKVKDPRLLREGLTVTKSVSPKKRSLKKSARTPGRMKRGKARGPKKAR